MGVPSFHKWLVNKYPEVVAPVVFTQQHTNSSCDATSPNPNGFEFDNLYLDINQIMFHHYDPADDPNGGFISVFKYVDLLFSIVRPRKLLYFVFDGVAPMAKMNDIRAGLYMLARNENIVEAEEDRLRSQYEREGKKLLPKAESRLQDDIIMMPGTKVMCELSKAIEVYIQTMLQENPAWKNLKVIVSDANVPGEGLHKIMSFIRSQRSLPEYNVNTRHCVHSLDEDCIMMALATHELHFSILREQHVPPSMLDSDIGAAVIMPRGSYKFVRIWVLREYLELDMRPSDIPEGLKFDTERVVDDFVFLCFFVGNDFLPHLPSLRTHEGALDLLLTVYKRDFKSIGGYLVDAHQVIDPKKASYLKLERVQRFILSVGSYEDKIFNKRSGLRRHQMGLALNDQSASRDEEAEIHVLLDSSLHLDGCGSENDNVLENTKQLKKDVRKYRSEMKDIYKASLFSRDEIKYGTSGWKERYYLEKIATKDHDKLESIEKTVVEEYVRGLCWGLLYYFSEVPSWNWFYQFHYGPCVSDMKGIGELQVEFEQGFPLEPFDQLMAALPPRLAYFLPRAYRNLMTDESSYIASFSPREFDVDIDRKKFLSQAQAILPFIDGKRLLTSTRSAKGELKEDEAERNLTKSDLLFVRASSDFGNQLLSKIDENPRDTNGVGGFVNLNPHALNSSEGEDRIVCVSFGLAKSMIFVPRILEHVKFPDERTAHECDIEETVLWHEQRRGHGLPNQTRYNEQNEDIGGSGQRGRGRGLSSSPSVPNSREGVYRHPNWCNSISNSRSSSRPYSSRGQNPSYPSGGRFWTHTDSQDSRAAEQDRSNRW